MKPNRKQQAATAVAWPAINTALPCGPSLEYDNDFIVLQAQLQPAPEVQYGEFTDRRSGPDWAEIERQCRALLSLSIDINLLVWLARSRTRQAGAPGLLEGLALLASTLERYPEQIHPQPDVEGASSAELRANALAALTDPEGLLGDIRDIRVDTSALGRLSVRDVERACSVPRLADAMSIEQVMMQLGQLRQQADAEVVALANAMQEVARVSRWTERHLQGDACDLGGLSRLLQPFGATSLPNTMSIIAAARPETEVQVEIPAPASEAATGVAQPMASRQEAQACIDRARQWFETHEPSSPVGVLLRQAQRLVGKRYAEVAAAIPAELLARWDAPDDAPS